MRGGPRMGGGIAGREPQGEEGTESQPWVSRSESLSWAESA